MIGLVATIGAAIASIGCSKINFNSNNYITRQVVEEKQQIWAKGQNDENTYFTDVEEYYQIGYNPIDIPHAVHIDRNYKLFLKFDFPYFQSVKSATLKLYKASGNIERIGASYYLTNPNLSSSTEFISSGSLKIIYSSTNLFEIDLTEGVNEVLSKKDNVICISMDISWSGGYGKFYKYEEGSEYSPELIISPNDEPLENSLGNAKPFRKLLPGEDNQLNLINCYKYALDDYNYNGNIEQNDRVFPYCRNQIYTKELFYNTIVPNLLEHMYIQKNRFGRVLEDIDSPIYKFEWRIAMRVRYDTNGKINDFHFMKQTSLGSWCEHFPENSSDEFENFNPITNHWTRGYNSDTVIIAVSYR